ncbi:MAG: hypothetical protein CVU08_05205 [Bacteroidetes bacterium HGW-Bacteroidetes-3]|jgi:heat shock protein HslJ|nr:MAG: hypothetical protein CVU08_05205 [Bacteroidetes bacterium HGW-Bacteroidetes-3]
MKTNSLIKKSIFLLVVAFFLNSCSKEDISYDLIGSWKVIYYINDSKKITKTDDNTWPDINNGDITANFSEPDSNGKGTVSGFRVSNVYSGDYTINNDGNITFGEIIQTYINEPDWTKLYNLSSVEHYQIRRSILLLYHNNDKTVIGLERN